MNKLQRNCKHDWKETRLIVSMVKDCIKCLAKWEDYIEYLKEESEMNFSMNMNGQRITHEQIMGKSKA